MAHSIADKSYGLPYNEASDKHSRAAAYIIRTSGEPRWEPTGHTVIAVCAKCTRLTRVDVSVFELNTRALCPPCARELGQSGRG